MFFLGTSNGKTKQHHPIQTQVFQIFRQILVKYHSKVHKITDHNSISLIEI